MTNKKRARMSKVAAELHAAKKRERIAEVKFMVARLRLRKLENEWLMLLNSRQVSYDRKRKMWKRGRK